MTALTISVTESQMLTSLRTYVLNALGLADQNVVKGQGNRVAMPQGSFLIMTSLRLKELSTVMRKYNPPTAPAPALGSVDNMRDMEWVVQLDVYGTTAMDMAAILYTLIRTPYTYWQFVDNGGICQPLFASEPRNTTMVDAEAQYEDRWTFELHVQYSPVVQTPLAFISALEISLQLADPKLPPE
jgi:hypothetical protein